MIGKIFQKAIKSDHSQQHKVQHQSVGLTELEARVSVHYGIPSSASILAFDPVQSLLAIGTLDGKIKVIGGYNIEALLISPKPLPFKNLEFLQNQGFLVSVSNENELQVWDLEHRRIVSKLQWESNITAFSLICGSEYMYIGDEYGFLSVLKFDNEKLEILQMPYNIPANLIIEAAGVSSANLESIVGVLSQPFPSGNRVLIAYENGLIVLWDITEDRAVLVRGHKDLQPKSQMVLKFPNDVSNEDYSDSSDHEQQDKEISSICWASSDGSLLAVGYVDGDILLWNLSDAGDIKDQKTQNSSNSIVKLQLSTAEKRLPVIVLHWSTSSNDHRGHLFVYGGDEIGSEEVLAILILDWASGIEKLKRVDRVDLALSGSFADMILLPNTGAVDSSDAISLFVLTNPGEIHFYDDDCLSTLTSEPEKKHSVHGVQYPVIIPTIEPSMTVGKLKMVHNGGSSLRAIMKTTAQKLQAASDTPTSTTKWPLTGGVPSQRSFDDDISCERLYIAGYQDGTVRIWDATFPTLSLLFVLERKVEVKLIAGIDASISALEFSSNLSLAVGNECGLVRLYRLFGSGGTNDVGLQFVTRTKSEVYDSHHENGFQCTTVFSFLDSPVRTLLFVNSGDKLAVGFESGQVAMLDIHSRSILFITKSVASSSPIVSLAVQNFLYNMHQPDHSENEDLNRSTKEVGFVLTKDAHVVVLDSIAGNIISSISVNPKTDSSALLVHVLEGSTDPYEFSDEYSQISSRDSETQSGTAQFNYERQSESVGGQSTDDSLILLCCENSLYIYSAKSLIQGDANSIHKVNLAKRCCWITTFRKDGKEYGLIVVYQTGMIEIRSLPDLEVLGETSITSILRWNFRTNTYKTLSSSDKGQITLVNGCEFAIISLLDFENDFRIPEALPCLHDKVLAAATAVIVSQNQKKKQSTTPRILGNIIKGFTGNKVDEGLDPTEVGKTVSSHLEGIFSRSPFSGPTNAADDDIVELKIDDIEIDEPVYVSSSHEKKHEKKGKEVEREKLFEGGSTDTKPRVRTREEIIAKYRKDGDASSVAAQAKNKLMERGEKLEKLTKNTEELQSGAENFASMANELAKAMEKRKWWNI